MSQKQLIVVVGPTGIGKTRLAIALAKHYDTEIVSADSRQFFQEMAIGTAVPPDSELSQVPHHFIQHKSIHEPYSVGDFERDTLCLLEELFKEKDIVIMVGGSGLYVDAVVNGLDEFPQVSETIRKELQKILEADGLDSLQQELREVDANYASKVDLENPHRVLRALSIYRASGRPYSSYLKKPKKNRFFNSVYLGITAAREVIYERIENRVDQMMKSGLLEEAKQLYAYRSLNALQTVGYKELFGFIDGRHSLEAAISEIKKHTRRYAKRQLTWYRKNEAILWIDYDTPTDKVLELVNSKLQQDAP